MHRGKQFAAGRTLTVDGVEVSTADYDVRLIIAGSRGYSDYHFFSQVISTVYAMLNQPVLFISGAAKSGGDALILDWCKEQEILCAKFPADWDKNGKSAGYIRNAEMAEVGTHLIAFWDGVSKGTKHMIDLAKQKGLAVQVILIDSENTSPRTVQTNAARKKQHEYRMHQETLLESNDTGNAQADPPRSGDSYTW